jgi:PAS domain S-box-containing protein
MLCLPASPLRNPSRLAALEETGLVSWPPTAAFDRLTRFGTAVLRVPMTAITVIEEDRQVVLSHSGLPESWASHRTTPVGRTFCQHVVRTGEPLIVEDARRHPLVRNSPLIREAGVVAYAGLPWRTPDGFVQGAYCAMDVLPRTWAAEELRLLSELADMVTDIVGERIAHPPMTGVPGPSVRPLAEAMLQQPLAGVFMLQDGQVRYANRRLAAIFGYSQAELLALDDALVLFAGEDREQVAELLRRCLDGQPEGGLQLLRGRRKDGEIVWLNLHGTRVIADGEPAIGGIAVDVSEWKRSEALSRASEERLRLAVRAINDVTWEWEIPTGTLRWGDETHRVLRYEPDEMGRSIEWWVDRLHEEDRERVTSKLHAMVAGRSTFWSDEYRFQRGDGSSAILLDRGYLVRDQRGVPLRVIGAMRDVSERRRGEDAQRLLARASTVLDGSLLPDAAVAELINLIVPAFADFCVIQRSGSDREAASESVSRHVDAGREASLLGPIRTGREDTQLHPLLRESIRSREAILISGLDEGGWGRLGISPEERGVLEPLHPKALLVTPMLFRDDVLGAIAFGIADSGRALDAVDRLVAKDLAHRLAMALGGARLYKEAQAAIQARDDILNMVTHDLRNPLSTIQIGVDLLENATPERREENRKWLEIIGRSTKQMDAMIEDLLDLARIDGGRFAIEAATTPLPVVMALLQEVLEPLAARKGQHFDCSAEEDVGSILADPFQIQRVFSNLVGNALKFTPEGGHVRIRAERAGTMVRFTVRDDGPGIPADQLPYVFDRYWQARQSDRRGVGLGLAIAKGIVEAHGGTIWAENLPGEGASFQFTIPSTVDADGHRTLDVTS